MEAFEELLMDDAPNLAVFCDFENIALGVRDAEYDSFDIQIVLERLLDKGKIVVKKAYADWDRYKAFKRPLHEAAFELIEIPHVSYSGKNSADIRLVVDALDLCYTKTHVNAFVILSGDSDFSPLVSKLRENNKQVVGLGVKNSTSDLLIENCDEFIYYDDLVRKKGKRKAAKAKPKSFGGRRGPPGRELPLRESVSREGAGRDTAPREPVLREAAGKEAQPKDAAAKEVATKGALVRESAAKEPSATKDAGVGREGALREVSSAAGGGAAGKDASAGEAAGKELAPPKAGAERPSAGQANRGKNRPRSEEELVELREEAIELVLDTVEALFEERDGNLWGSMVKQTLKRKRPTFSENFHGFESFSQLLEDAERQGLLELHRDDKSGGYVIVSFGPNA